MILMVGLVIAHFGVTLFIQAALGSDPFNVLIQGLFRGLEELTGWEFLTHGRVHMAVCLIIILILLIAARSYIKIGTIVCMIFGGPIIDLFTLLLGGVYNAESPELIRYPMLVLGCVILAGGMTVVIQSEAGTGPNDLVAVVISDKLGRSFAVTRVTVDGLFVLTGFLLGGTVGIGTIICAFLVGPVAGKLLPVSKKLIDKIISRAIQEKR